MTDERNIAEDLESIRRQLEQLVESRASLDDVAECTRAIAAVHLEMSNLRVRLDSVEQEIQRLKNPIGYGAAPLPPPISRSLR